MTLAKKGVLIAWEDESSLHARTAPVFECVFCRNGKRIFREPVMKKRSDGGYVLSGEFAFHAQDTHGFPPDILVDMIQTAFAGRERFRDQNNGET